MLKEGIKEEPEGDQLQEPEETFDLFTKEAKELVFDTDGSEEAAEAQRALQLVTRYVSKKHEEKRAQGIANGESHDDIDIDESSDEEEEEYDDEYFQDEAELMADIKEQSAALPTGGEGEEGQKMTIEQQLNKVAEFRANAVTRLRERKAKEKEAKKTKESKAKEGKIKKPKTNQVNNGNGKKKSVAASSRKDQVEQNAVNAGA